MRYLLILSFVASGAKADMVSLPTVTTGNGGMADNAANSALKAAYMQSGLNKTVEGYATTVSKEGETIGYKILDFTPISRNTWTTAGGIGYFSYEVGVKHQLSQSFNDPFVSKVNHTLSLNMNSAMLTTGISW